MASVYLVVEEPESGYYADYDNHLTLSAHRTEVSAQAAVEAWRASHEGPRGEEAHPFEGGDECEHWCSCGLGVHMEQVALRE